MQKYSQSNGNNGLLSVFIQQIQQVSPSQDIGKHRTVEKQYPMAMIPNYRTTND